jgi:prepilin-type N-terminal cleavage/methylation domain-containing protein
MHIDLNRFARQRNLARAFTLIELLIVVAIIAILAAIAVPNFLEAQTRAKISRAMADQRAIATGLETYRIDWNKYIYGNGSSRAFRPGSGSANDRTLERLTSPVAYMTGKASFKDPFLGRGTYQGNSLENKTLRAAYDALEEDGWFDYYWYSPRSSKIAGAASIWTHLQNVPVWYALESAGPDGWHHNLGGTLNNMADNSAAHYIVANMAIYDASNGTVSRGSIFRVGGTPAGSGQPFFHAVQQAMH